MINCMVYKVYLNKAVSKKKIQFLMQSPLEQEKTRLCLKIFPQQLVESEKKQSK